MSWTVFYAWQSDSPNNTNRSLIQRALEAAIDEVRAEGSLVFDPRLDKDTLGVPGSPDIDTTIFEKIEKAAVFVADVTIVTPEGSRRPSPNPNVLIELGYAIHALGSRRVVMVMNTAFGSPGDLPFDISRKRALTYRLPEDASEKAPERKLLQKQLTEAVRASLTFAEQVRASVPTQPSLADSLIASVEQGSPTQRGFLRQYVADVIKTLDRLRPASNADDDGLVASIDATRDLVTTFAGVTRTLVTHRAGEALEGLFRLFEPILMRYEASAVFPDGAGDATYDFFKFIGHELFVIAIALLLEDEAWDLLDQLLNIPFSLTGGSRDDRTVSFDRISKFVRLLDEVRREKTRTPTTTRISVHADILKERYATGGLSSLVSWEQFRAADYFLFLRVAPEVSGTWTPRLWRAWSVLYLNSLPAFVLRSTRKSYAARVAKGLGLSDAQELKKRLQVATERLQDFYKTSFWSPPGNESDWSKIAST